MARRRLLTGDERRCLFDPPADQAGIIANYTLSADDIELIGRRYGATNRLGLACHIALMRHPGFGLPFSADVPDAILGYLAAQLFVDPKVFAAYGRRPQTRHDHAEIVAGYRGLRTFRRQDIPLALNLAMAVAEQTNRGEPIIRGLMAGLKHERFILPSPEALERTGLAGRARARKAAASPIIEALGQAQIAHIDNLVVNNVDLRMTPLAWRRNFEDAPTATDINGLLERLRFVREIGIDAKVCAAIP